MFAWQKYIDSPGCREPSCVRQDTDPELHHITERRGNVFTKVDLSLIDSVPIAARDGAECWHDNYQHRLITAAPALEPHLPARSQLRSVQTVFIKSQKYRMSWVCQNRWPKPECVGSKKLDLQKATLPLYSHDHILNPHFCCVDSVLYLGTRSLAAFWFKRGTGTEILIEELCTGLVTHGTIPGTDSSKLDSALVFVISNRYVTH